MLSFELLSDALITHPFPDFLDHGLLPTRHGITPHVLPDPHYINMQTSSLEGLDTYEISGVHCETGQ